MSIKKKIYWSFAILVLLFVLNGVITISIIRYNKSLTKHLNEVINPSIRELYVFKNVLLQSQMYSANWVFIRSNDADKEKLIILHYYEYPRFKKSLTLLSAQWYDQRMADTLQHIFVSFEQLIGYEKKITTLLKKFDDYENVVKKFEAEEIVENNVIPMTLSLTNMLSKLLESQITIQEIEDQKLTRSSVFLRNLIVSLTIITFVLAFLLSVYMSGKIIFPINKIRTIVNDLSKGVITQLPHKGNNDEIDNMIHAVNHLSEKLQERAMFASEVGKRNFQVPFSPLSDDDVLGKALIDMRDNIKNSDERINEAQLLAKIGNWNFDLTTQDSFWSDGMKEIYELDKYSKPGIDYFTKFIVQEDKERIQKELIDIIKDGKPTESYFKITTSSGEQKTLKSKNRVYLNENDQPVRIYGVVQDVTERIKMDEERLRSKLLAEESEQIKKLMEQINISSGKLKESINYAKRLQSEIFVSEELFKRNLPDSFIVNHPKEIVSGDFMWFNSVNDLHILSVADCTGHGVPGALLSTLGYTMLNNIILENQIVMPDQILKNLVLDWRKTFSKYNKQANTYDGMEISICSIDYKKMVIRFSAMGGALYLLRNSELIEYKGEVHGISSKSIQPTGSKDINDILFHDIPFQKNDCIYLFSDGYRDQFGGPAKNDKYTKKRFKELLSNISGYSIFQQNKMVDEAFVEWKGANVQMDDVLVIGIKL